MRSIAIHSTAVGLAAAARIRAAARWLVNSGPRVAQSTVEYAIVAAVIAVLALAAVRALGPSLDRAFQAIGTQVERAPSEAGGG